MTSLFRRSAWWRRGLPGRGRVRRRLAGIEVALETETRLALMFATFNAVTRGEPASGPEPLPRPGRLPRFVRPAPWLGRIAAIVVMAAVIAGGLLLSSTVRPVMRSCQVLSGTGTTATVDSHVQRCAAYPMSK